MTIRAELTDRESLGSRKIVGHDPAPHTAEDWYREFIASCDRQDDQDTCGRTCCECVAQDLVEAKPAASGCNRARGIGRRLVIVRPINTPVITE